MNLKFTNEQLAILNEALIQLPYRVAAPLIQQINHQLKLQTDAIIDSKDP